MNKSHKSKCLILLIIVFLFIDPSDLIAYENINFEQLVPNKYENRSERTTEFIRRHSNQPIKEISEEQKQLTFEGNKRFEKEIFVEQLFQSSSGSTSTITYQAIKLDLFKDSSEVVSQYRNIEVNDRIPPFLIFLMTATILFMIGLCVILYFYFKSVSQGRLKSD
ncbi:YueC family protein [Amphibacillus sp. MSJ-3]|uniref:type VII secretion EssA family protein n=1 Tax=Amphibacillus sp. MSJ-3 TaxID=2841505 RepID=UPI001C0ED6F4|nr:type VII secretion EssA family protein [Amphibacillus sp. MSJ-3]MBU5594933.1 YueC family protein [Amphibacillus sp. MSJ-3]